MRRSASMSQVLDRLQKKWLPRSMVGVTNFLHSVIFHEVKNDQLYKHLQISECHVYIEQVLPI